VKIKPFSFHFSTIYFLLLDQKKVTKKNQEIVKAIFQKLLFLKYHSIKAKTPPGLRRFLTLLFHFASPISLF
jgi:hypothetical protein